MKTRLNKKSYFLLAILTIFVFSSFMAFGQATTDDFTFNIDEFKEKIQGSPNDSWKKPAQNRKNTICNKLTELQQLIGEDNFEEAYDKLLYDIKPKLTGLKEDEHGIPWGNGAFKNPWVTSDDLQAEFCEDCDWILSEINPQVIGDDDKTPPEISISYGGGYYVTNPGIWSIEVTDLESGLDEVFVEINGIKVWHDIDLQGVLSENYEFPVPTNLGTNTIVVTAKNHDFDFIGDQETSMLTVWVELKEPTPPIILITHGGGNIDENPGTWEVTIDDPEEGLSYVEIKLDDVIEIQEYPMGTTSLIFADLAVSSVPGDHMIEVNAENVDGYSSLTSATETISDDDLTGPIISVTYIGSETEQEPGWWNVQVEDFESGLDEIEIVLNQQSYAWYQDLGGVLERNFEGEINGIQCPALRGTHVLEIHAKNYDYDRMDDQESSDLVIEQAIIEDPLTDDDMTPPEITISYDGGYSELNPGAWDVTVEDLESGLDTVTILVDESEWIQESLERMNTKTYSVPVPGTIGSHEIRITTVNDDNDRPDDQESNTESDTVIIEPIEHDNTDPIIYIGYDGSYIINDPGEWTVWVYDEESGIGEVHITASFEGEVYHEIHENFDGQEYCVYEISIPKIEGIHTVHVIGKNDINHDGVQETTVMDNSVEIGPYVPPIPLPGDDNSPPRLTIFYEGGHTGENPGTWSIHVKDYDSGLDEVLIEVDGIEYLHDTELGGIFDKIYWYIPVPSEPGIHIMKVTATNDIAYDGVQETGWKEHSVAIYPVITIIYTGSGNTDDPGYWSVSLEDPILGIWEVVIFINGVEYINENLGGVSTMSYSEIPVPAREGNNRIRVIAKDSAQNEIEISDVVDIVPGEDPGIPPIIIG